MLKPGSRVETKAFMARVNSRAFKAAGFSAGWGQAACLAFFLGVLSKTLAKRACAAVSD
jgi:c-di-AMP phosphodiesterase-like protein